METAAHFKLGHQVLRTVADLAGESDFRFRPDYELSFSANNWDEIWNFTTWGFTKPNERCFIRHELLREIVAQYQVVRPELGRFHVDVGGAYWGVEKNNKIKFIVFEYGDLSPEAFVVTKSLRITNSEKLRQLLERQV